MEIPLVNLTIIDTELQAERTIPLPCKGSHHDASVLENQLQILCDELNVRCSVNKQQGADGRSITKVSFSADGEELLNVNWDDQDAADQLLDTLGSYQNRSAFTP